METDLHALSLDQHNPAKCRTTQQSLTHACSRVPTELVSEMLDESGNRQLLLGALDAKTASIRNQQALTHAQQTGANPGVVLRKQILQEAEELHGHGFERIPHNLVVVDELDKRREVVVFGNGQHAFRNFWKNLYRCCDIRIIYPNLLSRARTFVCCERNVHRSAVRVLGMETMKNPFSLDVVMVHFDSVKHIARNTQE